MVREPCAGDRVAHFRTGALGTLVDFTWPFADWARVRWDSGEGPGMCDDRGLSYLAPGQLVRLLTS